MVSGYPSADGSEDLATDGQLPPSRLKFKAAALLPHSDVSTGLKGNQFRRFSGTQFGRRVPSRQHTTLPPRPTRPHVNELYSHATRSHSGQATTLRRTQHEKGC